MIPLAVLAVAAGLTAAGVGFALSYGALRSAAVDWGFTGWQGDAFPLGVDGLIIALYTADLVLAWRRMARPWVRVTAHALTAVTIALNISAAAAPMPGSPGLADAVQQDPGRLLGHAMMPIAYVILTEVARWAIVRTARLEAGGVDDQALTLADWILNFSVTWRIFQYAKTWPAPYAEARKAVRDLAVYKVWQKERPSYVKGSEQDRAGVLDRMPALLAPYGVSVDDARAIPAQMLAQELAYEETRKRDERKRDQEREQQKRADERAERERKRELERQERDEQRERERQEREDAHQARMDILAKEAQEAQQEGEVAELRATVNGRTRAAAHHAEAAVATAQVQASTALTAAQRAAEQTQRQAAAEAAAEESAKIVAARAKEKVESAKVAEESAKEAAALAKVKANQALVEEAEARTKAASAKLAQESAKVAEAEARVAEAEAAAAEARARTARAVLDAVEAEDLAGLTQRERRVRLVARTLLDSVPAEQAGPHVSPAQLEGFIREWSPVTNAQIAEAIGVTSEGTASQHKSDALVLIGRGYNHHTGYDPDRTSTQQ